MPVAFKIWLAMKGIKKSKKKNPMELKITMFSIELKSVVNFSESPMVITIINIYIR